MSATFLAVETLHWGSYRGRRGRKEEERGVGYNLNAYTGSEREWRLFGVY